jgi:hypothetical protein
MDDSKITFFKVEWKMWTNVSMEPLESEESKLLHKTNKNIKQIEKTITNLNYLFYEYNQKPKKISDLEI